MLSKILQAIKNPIIGPIIVSSIVVVFLSLFYMPKLSTQNHKQEIVHEAGILVSHLKSFRSYYTNNIVKKIKANTDLNINFNHATDENTIPLPATTIHNMSEVLTKNSDTNVNFYSDYPFPNRADRVLDKFQKESIKALRENPDKIFAKEDTINGKKVYRVAVADKLVSPSCVNCHNTRPDTPKDDWKLNDVRGVFEVNMPLENSFVLSSLQIKYVLGFLLLAVSGFLLHYSILYFKREKDLLNQSSLLEDEVKKRTIELQNSNQLLLEYKKAVDASAIVSKSDLKGNITYINDAFCEISGYQRDELLGKPHNIIRHPDVDRFFYKDLWQTIRSKEIFKGIIKNRAKDGSVYYVATTIVPILNDKGNIVEYLSLRYDITELVDAKEKAQAAEKAKSTFLANMSHEIRTPLNAIIGFSDILNDADLSSSDKEYANIINRSAKSLLGIINDVLDLSKIESGKLTLEKNSVDIETFLFHIVELFSIQAKEKNINFIFDFDSNLPKIIITDITRLQQVISNLLSNAIKFTDEGGDVKFIVKLVEQVENSFKISFLVKDSGIGMTNEQIQNVFEPFTQADDGISRKYGGTGLGLAICSDIIKLMGSKIELNSQPNRGSEFSFTLNMQKGNKLEIQEVKTDKYELSTNKKDINVLVAEDNINNQTLIKILLEKLGASCDIVQNGYEAIDTYKNNRYDIVLMDINMPELDGVSATKELQRLQKDEDLYQAPIIALTANSISGDRQKYIDSGLDDYLSKPIIFDELKNIFEKYIDGNTPDIVKSVEPKEEAPIEVNYKKSDAMKQLGLDELTVDMLIDNFFLTLDDDIKNLDKAIDSKDSSKIMSCAHYLKGSCANLAMNEAVKLLVDIETKAQNDQLDSIDTKKLKYTMDKIKESLQR
jgi:PAS domain S-box-containing protein